MVGGGNYEFGKLNSEKIIPLEENFDFSVKNMYQKSMEN